MSGFEGFVAILVILMIVLVAMFSVAAIVLGLTLASMFFARHIAYEVASFKQRRKNLRNSTERFR